MDNDFLLDADPIINNDLDINNQNPEFNNDNNDDDELINQLLSRVGIQNKDSIHFEEEEGKTITKNWNDISLEEKVNILTSDENERYDETDLDDSEIELINSIRKSKMSPRDFTNYLVQNGINRYLQQQQSEYIPRYQTDDIEDDVLFVSDIISKVGEENITDDELKEMLENAKSNPTLYQKQVQAIRQEYQRLEQENQQSQIEYKRQQNLAQYNRFAESVENSIRGFNSISGMQIEMSENEMEELYDFIVGLDQSGASTFGKALNNPNLLVRMAWFALNGDAMLQDLNNSFESELKRVKEESYKKGFDAASKSSSIYIPNNRNKGSNALDLV